MEIASFSEEIISHKMPGIKDVEITGQQWYQHKKLTW